MLWAGGSAPPCSAENDTNCCESPIAGGLLEVTFNVTEIVCGEPCAPGETMLTVPE